MYHREPYFKVTLSGINLVAGIEAFHNKNWKAFPKVVISGDWVPMGDEI